MKNIRRVIAVATLACASLFPTSNAQAVTLGIDTGWQYFSFGDVGSSWSTVFDFSLAGPAILRVTDAYLSGDQFDVLDFGTSLGFTSAPTSLGDQISADYDTAFADSRWSSAAFALSTGTYSISGTVVLSPYGSGGAAVRLDTAAPIPLPASGLLLLAGIGALGFLRRRRSV